MLERSWVAARRGLLSGALLGLLGCLGCSDYPDPYTDRCPTIWELEVGDITATTAVLTWQTDRLALARVRIRPEVGVERLLDDLTPGAAFGLFVDQLVPDTAYEVDVIPAAEGFGGVCGEPETIAFRTRPLNPLPGPEGDPVPDPSPPPPLFP